MVEFQDDQPASRPSEEKLNEHTGITHISITADLKLLTGLHIHAGGGEKHIGGVDNPVVSHPLTNEPYIPGSSLKGKIRNLLELGSGALQGNEHPLGLRQWRDEKHLKDKIRLILCLFGFANLNREPRQKDREPSQEEAKIFWPTRLSFWDCFLKKEWVEKQRVANQPLTEVKGETRINSISGTAAGGTLRLTERVPAGAVFDFRLSFKRLDQDEDNLLETVRAGLKLLEMDSLGASGSRGYGKVRFENLKIDGRDESLENIDPFDGRGTYDHAPSSTNS